ncbi:MAG TPA: hypothetical protein VHR72_04480 [Gemmataceae bacterium]|jgi:hypothetical protein|nr:hypothetical protein [Gemmataceae bacterium]
MLYRAQMAGAMLLILAGLAILAVGAGGIVVFAGFNLGATFFFCCVVGCGLFAGSAGFDLVYRSFTIDEAGLVRKDTFGLRRTGFAWEDVDSWLVFPGNESRGNAVWRMMYPDAVSSPSIAGRGLLFRVSGWSVPFFVAEGDVSVPSFDRFLVDVRLEAGDREIRPGRNKAPAPEPDLVHAIQLPVVTAIEPDPSCAR